MDYIAWLLQNYGPNGVVLDTNILLLYIVGNLDPSLLGKIKRTNQFEASDHTLLSNVLSLVPKLIVTPGILRESCNLLESANRTYGFALFGVIKLMLGVVTEAYTSAAVLSENVTFLKFGVTDCSIADLAAKGCIVVSDDLRLSTTLQGLGHPVVNFNHLRAADWIQ